MQMGMFADHWLLSWQEMVFSPISSKPNWHSNLRIPPFEKLSPSLIPYRGVPGSPQLSLSISGNWKMRYFTIHAVTYWGGNGIVSFLVTSVSMSSWIYEVLKTKRFPGKKSAAICRAEGRENYSYQWPMPSHHPLCSALCL